MRKNLKIYKENSVMSNLFKLLRMTFGIAMCLACESLNYTFEHELLERQFNCNML